MMRTLPVNGILTSLANNFNRRNKDVRLYELAKVYLPVEGEDLPDERTKLTLGFYGDGDFSDMKGSRRDISPLTGWYEEKRVYEATQG